MLKLLIAAALVALPAAALADPGPPVDPETCRFLPLADRYLLPPDHPCYLPPPEVCYDPGGWITICP